MGRGHGIYGIKITYPQPSLLHRTMVRIRAAYDFLGFLFGLVLCYAIAAGLLLMLGRLALMSDPPAWGALALIFLAYLAIGLFPLLWFGQMIDQARIAISGFRMVEFWGWRDKDIFYLVEACTRHG